MQTTLILCIHNHQPVGNLPDVFAHAYRDAYLPFLEALERFPGIKLALHNTGPLLEWYEENAPEYIERVRALVERGQVEILTGAFYEPILSAIPARDAAGQIAKMNEYVSSTFGVRARGMWLAERVWEPCHARTIAGAGVEYVPLDDYEFRLAGIADDDLTGYFVTEDQGIPLRIFPISKRLRYTIPFREPEETIAVLRELAERGPGLLAVFGDDGEKFGLWPGTHSHVHSGGWLERFLTALAENSDWLTTSTFSEFLDRAPARGRAYLPTSSYPEMMEWALPTPARRSYARLVQELERQDAADEWRPFLSGGIWKGFLAKYDEANVMARKMFRVSDKVASRLRTVDLLRSDGGLTDDGRGGGPADPPVDAAVVHEARNELWQGQCNCAYWHGVFGGLYLPHLRSAVYAHLIRAENLLDASRGKTWNSMDVVDHDLDGEDEVLLESHWANLYAAPARGGTLFELDLRRAETNILATMSRYDEAYHHAVDETVPVEEGKEESVPTIHGSIRAKQSGLGELAGRDRRPRRSAVDRFLAKGTGCEAARRGDAEDLGDFVDARYGFEVRREEGAVGVVMRRKGSVRGVDGPAAGVLLEKHAWLAPGGTVRIDYALTAEHDLDVLFAPEWNLAFLTPNTDYVYLTRGDSERRSLARRASFRDADGVSITDLLRGEVVSICVEPAGGIWTWPLETASQSEGGVERVFQGLTVTTTWPVRLKAGERASFSLALRARPAKE